jgi:hypothetical protein
MSLKVWNALGRVLTDGEAAAILDRVAPDEPTRQHSHVEPTTERGTMPTSYVERAARAGGFENAAELLTYNALCSRFGTPVFQPSEERLRAFEEQAAAAVEYEEAAAAETRRYSDQTAREKAAEDEMFAAYSRRMFPELRP